MSAIDLGMDFQMPKNQSSQIKVMGIGGGGSNAVNYMFLNGITGVDFVVCNTDAQALEASPVPIKIQLGATLTEGLGAGSNPEIGKKAAEESEDKITELLDANTKMLFLTAGMGGGTGTGAAPVIAEIAREKGILTVGVVTNPFSTEGGFRKQYAEEGVAELKKYVDTLLIINNDKLIEVYGDLTFTQAFGKANEILNTATKGIAEVISQHLLVNIDLNDARKVLENSGTAVMGQAEAEGENRAIEAVIGALDSPLLNDNDITGAQQVLLKIVTGKGEGEIRMSELSKIKNKIQEAAGSDVNIIEGIGVDPDLGEAVSVTVIATGFEQKKKPKGPKTIVLGDDKDLEDIITEDIIEDSVEDAENNQQKLDLEEDIIEETTDEIIEKTTEVIAEVTTEKEVEVIEPIVNTMPEKIVLDLEPEIKAPEEQEESAEQLITSILMEEEIQEEPTPTIGLDLKDEELVENEPTLNTLESTEVNADTMKVEARERESRLRAISQQLRTPSGLTDLEDVPAYQRNNIDLDQENHSSEDEKSTYTLSEGENNTTELKQNNSFLHDNVD
ncbi:cell division protein FtsZ [Flavobacteriales bacterium]|nr:cell division protein FtsZ [Flavobacteriales bacterium]